MMKIKQSDHGGRATRPGIKVPQLVLRTDLHAGEDDDKGCEAGVGYWRKEYNYWKNMAKSLGCA
jgi:hypothetical protein